MKTEEVFQRLSKVAGSYYRRSRIEENIGEVTASETKKDWEALQRAILIVDMKMKEEKKK